MARPRQQPPRSRGGSQRADRRPRTRDEEGIIPVLARTVREVEGAVERGRVTPSVRTKFQVVSLLVREARAAVRTDETITEAFREQQLKRLDGVATILAKTAARESSLLELLGDGATVSSAARRLKREMQTAAGLEPELEHKQGNKIMKLDSLRTLWIEEMRDLYNAENQIIKALPRMVKRASTPELKQAFETHLEETRGHVERLDEIFGKLGKKPTGKTCKGMQGLIEEGSEILKEDGVDSDIDAGLIAAAHTWTST